MSYALRSGHFFHDIGITAEQLTLFTVQAIFSPYDSSFSFVHCCSQRHSHRNSENPENVYFLYHYRSSPASPFGRPYKLLLRKRLSRYILLQSNRLSRSRLYGIVRRIINKWLLCIDHLRSAYRVIARGDRRVTLIHDMQLQ